MSGINSFYNNQFIFNSLFSQVAQPSFANAYMGFGNSGMAGNYASSLAADPSRLLMMLLSTLLTSMLQQASAQQSTNQAGTAGTAGTAGHAAKKHHGHHAAANKQSEQTGVTVGADSTNNTTLPDSTTGVDFGVLGHTNWQNSPYAKLSPKETIEKVKSLGLTSIVTNINDNPANISRTKELIAEGKKQGVKVIGTFYLEPGKYSNETQAYNDAKAKMAKLSKEFGKDVPVWQLGNEYDQWIVESNNRSDESSFGNAKPGRYQIVRGLLKGMGEGLEAGSPESKSIINFVPGHTDYMDQLDRDGVKWDITGFHWYSKDGDNLETAGNSSLKHVAEKFDKPIWMTEFNSWQGWGKATGSREKNAQVLNNEMQQIASLADKYNIIGADVYELLDEPGKKGGQDKFGVLDGNGNWTVTAQTIRNFMNSYRA